MSDTVAGNRCIRERRLRVGAGHLAFAPRHVPDTFQLLDLDNRRGQQPYPVTLERRPALGGRLALGLGRHFEARPQQDETAG
jgi:hypothetical protein